MRRARVKAKETGAIYHCMSRIVEKAFKLGVEEQAKFLELMRAGEAFCGVKIVTYCLMSNHVHLLVYVPVREPVSDEEFFARVSAQYSKFKAKEIRLLVEGLRRDGHDDAADEVIGQYTYRMYDISEFMKTLMQRFTQWYNGRNHRTGTLWEGRFKSVLVQTPTVEWPESGAAALTMAAYIDLNPVRAGIVDDPKDYRFSGYGEAVGGGSRAREGLVSLFQMAQTDDLTWGSVAARYRKYVFRRGARAVDEGQIVKAGFSPEEIQAVLDAKGKLTMGQLLHCRVRYFTDGLVIGTKSYVNGFFAANRERFGPKRKSGARKLKHGEWGDLCTARDLRIAPVTVPG